MSDFTNNHDDVVPSIETEPHSSGLQNAKTTVVNSEVRSISLLQHHLFEADIRNSAPKLQSSSKAQLTYQQMLLLLPMPSRITPSPRTLPTVGIGLI